ncbi:type II toxin-antitoxin system RelE/ParE family toxin [Methylobacterium sp. B4]|uniref:type II toxin-antitoxin system RelE/ParE family toxin n=1 Tax=Methylobacterium sp. B4 TaxID=1938755 RepID=UPI000D76600D|nr:type II toxin-antitoxin system RelE/ParE family toxin [Methylobacterium sp. B4]PXW65238.1 ParE-like toxin of type II ParDE toxin-antitoxin system [Methylobacterium sp. B4]
MIEPQRLPLRFQRRALSQIDAALGYVRDRSPQGAAKIEARLSYLLRILQEQPYLGVRTSVHGVRRVFLTPYPYLIDYYLGDEIVVQRFRHTARRPLK